VTKRKHDLPTNSDSTHQRIRAVIRTIPYGQVRAYAEVALAAGLPGRARLVARVLAQSSENRAKRMHCPGIVCYAPMDGSPSPPTRMPSKHSDYALKQRESMCGMAA